MKERKPVRYSPMFDKLSIGKSADVHDVDGHWFAGARIDARCLATRPDRIAAFNNSFDSKCQILNAAPSILDLRFQYLRAG